MPKDPLFGQDGAEHPRTYNDVCIALLARQIGATVVKREVAHIGQIAEVIHFQLTDVEDPSRQEKKS